MTKQALIDIGDARISDVAAHPLFVMNLPSRSDDALRAAVACGTRWAISNSAGVAKLISIVELRDARLDGGWEELASSATLCVRPFMAVDAEAPFCDAIARMRRLHAAELVVVDRDSYLGVIDEQAANAFIAGYVRRLATAIAGAQDVAGLKEAFSAHQSLIRAQHVIGAEPLQLGRSSSEVHRAIFRRVFELTMPDQWRGDVCLIVMGSEGRGEQILPTDQDNALIVRDDVDVDAVAPACRAFSALLGDIGYPPCSGNIMVSNPNWVVSESHFRERLSSWIRHGSHDDVMNLAIFLDATPIAGDPELFAKVRQALFDRVEASDACLARFANAINAFPVPIGLFSRLLPDRGGEHAGTLDIKKGALFQLVHGVRSYALERRLDVTGTLERIDALVAAGLIDAAFGVQLATAFQKLCALRLDAGLKAVEASEPACARIRPADLSVAEQDALVVCLRTVQQLCRLVASHFRLDLISL